MTWANAYVGLPYADDGRTGGLHCWSLVRRVLAEQCGIDVPEYGEISATNLAAAARSIGGDHVRLPWITVGLSEAREFDIVVMVGRVKLTTGITRRLPTHTGIMVDTQRMLHIEAGYDAVLVPLSHPSVTFRVHRIVRHERLADVATARA